MLRKRPSSSRRGEEEGGRKKRRRELYRGESGERKGSMRRKRGGK